MNTEKTSANGVDLAVLVQGDGFYYAIRRYVDDTLKARRRRNAARRIADELDHLPEYLKQDIGWTDILEHERN